LDHLLSGVMSSASAETIPVNLEGPSGLSSNPQDSRQPEGKPEGQRYGLLFGLERPISPTGQ
jgi:hypothetical protein